ncbi:MAG: hypothetical protein KDJ69_02145 [Nitratireductor sp.]|nr:hypothetical protein [Nitratireductor sp.]
MDWKSDQLGRLQTDLEAIDWWINALETGAVVQHKSANGELVDQTEQALEAYRQLRVDLLVLIDRLSGNS